MGLLDDIDPFPVLREITARYERWNEQLSPPKPKTEEEKRLNAEWKEAVDDFKSAFEITELAKQGNWGMLYLYAKNGNLGALEGFKNRADDATREAVKNGDVKLLADMRDFFYLFHSAALQYGKGGKYDKSDILGDIPENYGLSAKGDAVDKELKKLYGNYLAMENGFKQVRKRYTKINRSNWYKPKVYLQKMHVMEVTL